MLFHSLAGVIRGILADYGVPLLVVFWTALSYAFNAGGNPRGETRTAYLQPSNLPSKF
jgi:hypothetical protein